MTMRANRGRDTRPELAVRKAVHALGLRYRVSIRPLGDTRRTADLVFPRAKVAVFIDGCFWHRCPDHFVMPKANRSFWEAKMQRNTERDRETDDLLAAAGWVVIRVWEHQGAIEAAARVATAVREARAAKRRY